MTQTLNRREDPLNLGGGGWAASIPSRTWSSFHRRRGGAPMYKGRYRHGAKAEHEACRKQAKQKHCPGPWWPPPCQPYWPGYPSWGPCAGPWRPPAMAFQSPLCLAEVIRAYGLQPLCLCCCPCWSGHWSPGWAAPPARKKRWGFRGRGLRRQPRHSVPRNPPIDLSKLLRPVNLYGWRAPGMRAPRNTTQFIMNQIYEDMRKQEKMERQQEALRAQQVQAAYTAAPGHGAPPGGLVEDWELQESLYGYIQDPALALSPMPVEPDPSPTPPRAEQEEKPGVQRLRDEELYDEKLEESEEEEEEDKDGETEDEDVDEEEAGEAQHGEEGEEGQEAEAVLEEGMEEEDQMEEDSFLPLGMPLSILVGEEDDGENFLNFNYLSSEQMIPKVPEEDQFTVPDIDQ
uniref:coiled-coil domain-containing glutamate-rich protein 1 n=1 Tax=Jaculus jaculus TaxID=51337 RepID=UPI0003332237|nr:coiled-coil domain-containing glutamate-rich protein 1 [Jaculus jaculus]